MKTVVIANPTAGAGRVGRCQVQWQRQIAAAFNNISVQLTSCVNEATEFTRDALHNSATHIIVIGGDGTLNEVVNGFFDPDNHELLNRDAVLAYLPSATGGDFGRSFHLKGLRYEEILTRASIRPIDIGCADFTANDGSIITRHFINISSFGSSGEIVARVNRMHKRFGGRVSFLWGTLRTLINYKNRYVRLRIDDVFDEELLINVVAVANARYLGGGMKIAPNAIANDGYFDVVIGGNINLGVFLKLSGKLYCGEHLGYKAIQCFRGREVIAEPVGKQEDVLIDFDGEQPGKLPARYKILPAAINLMAPWDYSEVATLDTVLKKETDL